MDTLLPLCWTLVVVLLLFTVLAAEMKWHRVYDVSSRILLLAILIAVALAIGTRA